MNRPSLQEKIEEIRHCMYEAYLDGTSYDRILRLSQHLDFLLNRLRTK